MSIIKNYGFLWERKNIFRGTGGSGNTGHLEGKANGKPKADFREQIGVYVLYDKNQNIVYVGQAGNGNATLFSRLKNHMDGALWNRWEYFTWVGFRGVTKSGVLDDRQKVESSISGYKYSDALNEIEGILIEVIEPKLNKQSGRLQKAVEYFQVLDERISSVSIYDLQNELDQISSKLDKISQIHRL